MCVFFGSELRKLCHYCLKSGRSMGNSQSTFYTALDSMTNGSEVLIYLTSLSFLFLPKEISEWIYEVIVSPKIWTKWTKYCILPCTVPHYRAEIFTIFGSYFGRNNDFINSFWNLLTFTVLYFTLLGKIARHKPELWDRLSYRDLSYIFEVRSSFLESAKTFRGQNLKIHSRPSFDLN